MSVTASLSHRPTSDKPSKDIATSTTVRLPHTPPGTDVDSDDGSSISAELDVPLPPPSTTQSILDIDKSTPDAHASRDPRLIRLTGTHPFNAEAPLSDLYNEGFLTSPELFYVRNHGAVPRVHDAECLDWEFSVEGYEL
jgi:nitrate reductase (NAD(P)H)